MDTEALAWTIRPEEGRDARPEEARVFCQECGALNQNQNYCHFCGERISHAVQSRATPLVPADPTESSPGRPVLPTALYASWRRRVTATAVDGFVLAVLAGLPLIGFQAANHPVAGFGRTSTTGAYLCATKGPVAYAICHQSSASSGMSFFAKALLVTAVVLPALWLLASVRSLGAPARRATFGMKFVGVEVVREKNHHIGKFAALVRLVVALALAATIVGGLLDLFWPLVDEKHRSLHDIAVGAVMLEAARSAWR